MQTKKILLFASGSANGGGSGSENLVRRSKIDDFNIEIIAVVSNHAHGGVQRYAEMHCVPFYFFSSGEWSAPEYREIFQKYPHDLLALSGWLKPMRGNDKTRTINIHPARLPRFGGKRMHGDNIHAAVLEAYRKGEVSYSGVSIHFVPDYEDAGYDQGPVFFDYWVPVREGDTIETLKKRVSIAEHHWQPYITSLVAHGQIYWDTSSNKIIVPPGYPFLPKSVSHRRTTRTAATGSIDNSPGGFFLH